MITLEMKKDEQQPSTYSPNTYQLICFDKHNCLTSESIFINIMTCLAIKMHHDCIKLIDNVIQSLCILFARYVECLPQTTGCIELPRTQECSRRQRTVRIILKCKAYSTFITLEQRIIRGRLQYIYIYIYMYVYYFATHTHTHTEREREREFVTTTFPECIRSITFVICILAI